jgi:acyl carrier protein
MIHVLRRAIAQQLDVAPETIGGDDRLREDLGLSEAELAEVVAHAEALDLGSDEFPIEALDRIRTVDELISTWQGWSAERDTYENVDLFQLEPPTWPG